MTDRELMQQALEALKKCRYRSLADEIVDPAITALNERLAHCDRCGKKLGGPDHIHTCSPMPRRSPLTIREIGQVCGNFSDDTVNAIRSMEAFYGVKEQNI